MPYFQYFPRVNYKFGDETLPDIFTNISRYASVLDDVRDNIAFYFDYTISEFERPDQTSFKIYGTTDYHWTFFAMNDHIRERGWPLTNREIIAKAIADYPNTTLVTRTPLAGKFKVGQTVEGVVSAATGTILHKNVDLGQVTLSSIVGSFSAGELISSTNSDGEIEQITLTSSSLEYLAAHHYENSDKEYVDIDPTVGPGALINEITNQDRYISLNDELKDIRIIKPDSINQVINAFRGAIAS